MRTPALATVFVLLSVGCGSSTPPLQPRGQKPDSQRVFDFAAPAVVAILNDDRSDREQEIQEFAKEMGDEAHAPRRVIDVSLRKEPSPHGTGFLVHGGIIVTAAHVVMRPDRLKVTTRFGQTSDAELVRIDEVRDVAILRAKDKLKNVTELDFDTRDPVVGEKIWALGHTGHGFWALSWGMSEGIASGLVDMFGAKLLLSDAAVYPGFSGGPVLAVGEDGKPKVVGVNHAILFTGGNMPIASISSAVSLREVEDVVAGHPPAIQPILADYAKKQSTRLYADLFITDKVSVSRDASEQQVANIFGHQNKIEVDGDRARIPSVAMLFNLPKGEHEVLFELHDPHGNVVASEVAHAKVAEKQRLSFVSGTMVVRAKTHGKFSVTAKYEGKEIGRTFVTLELEDDDHELNDEHDSDSTDDGDPDVDIVVAQGGRDNPLSMFGVRAAWSERSYPRRVGYTWFARGTRGWSGTNVSITAFVLDDQGVIVGRSDGCLTPELRPERTWACVNSGGMAPPPMPQKVGHYDIVFAINNRPVAWWPMEAMVKQSHAPGSDVERWMKEVRRVVVKRKKHGQEEGPSMPGPGPATSASAVPRPMPPVPSARPR